MFSENRVGAVLPRRPNERELHTRLSLGLVDIRRGPVKEFAGRLPIWSKRMQRDCINK